jgi:outer membrane lipopolysaccharide assembly protein LptE/RlpB
VIATRHPLLRALRGALAAAIALLGTGGLLGCGYHLSGKGSNLPAHIKTIGVPPFENTTTRPELGQRVTEAVIEQLVGRGKYKIVPESTGVDAVLKGSILSFSARPLALTTDAQASRATVTLQASVRFEDLVENRVLWQQENYSFSADYQVVGDPTQYFDTQLTAVEEVAADFARAVVSAVLQGF